MLIYISCELKNMTHTEIHELLNIMYDEYTETDNNYG